MSFKNDKFHIFIISFSIIVISVIAPWELYGQRTDNKKLDSPNVILILADDMGVGDLSMFNDGLTDTPELDALINQSMYFTNAYSGSAVCAPSRAALLTGRYPHRTGSVTLNQRRYPDLTRIHKDETTIADIFGKNGYVSGLIGKWHSGDGPAYHPLKRGFDKFFGFKGWYIDKDYYNYKLDIQGEVQSFKDTYLTDELTRHAVDFVNRYKNQPFFLHLAHYAPHRPLSAPQELIDKYKKRGVPKNAATIYAMIEVMDSGIGRVVEELERLGIAEDTIIVFSSDNGPDPVTGERFNNKLRGTKYTIYEGGIHVPFFIRWPGNIKPGMRDEIIHFTDVLPTLADILSLEVPNDLKWDGGSFKKILFDKNVQPDLPERRYWQWNRGVPFYSHNAAMREGDWKLVRPYVTRNIPEGQSTITPELYNIADDPFETTDLSEKYSQRYDRMRVLLRQWSREMEIDRLNIEN